MGISYKQSLQLQPRVEQKFMQSQHMQLALKVLSMPIEQLESYLLDVPLENPALEIKWRPKEHIKNARILAEISCAKEKSLFVYLMEQAQYVFSGKDLVCAENIIGNINEKGFFQESLDSIRKDTSMDRALQILEKIQTFKPLGIGQKSVQESLLFQMGKKPSLEKIILKKFYTDFLHQRIDVLSTVLDKSEDIILESIAKIKKYNPFPGLGFSSDYPQYISAEITVEFQQGKWIFQLADIPILACKKEENITHTWKKEGEWIIQTVQRRQEMLIQATKMLVARQELYLLQQEREIFPLTLGEIAETLDVHISTISRLLSYKFIKTPLGTLPFSHFF